MWLRTQLLSASISHVWEYKCQLLQAIFSASMLSLRQSKLCISYLVIHANPHPRRYLNRVTHWHIERNSYNPRDENVRTENNFKRPSGVGSILWFPSYQCICHCSLQICACAEDSHCIHRGRQPAWLAKPKPVCTKENSERHHEVSSESPGIWIRLLAVPHQ